MMRIAIAGAAGRMGRTLIRLIGASEDLQLAALWERADHPELGREAGDSGVTFSAIADTGNIDAVVDFSLPEGTAKLLDFLLENPLPLVSGTTGLDEEAFKKMDRLAQNVPVIWAPNFSTGVNLLFQLTKLAAEVMGPQSDPEIVEVHHRHKKDAPSGTAAKLADIVSETLSIDTRRDGRGGAVGERPAKEIGLHAVRGGEVPGEHTVYFFGAGERLELTHRLGGREALAAGALRAAQWISGVKPGRYDMNDVLGLKG